MADDKKRRFWTKRRLVVVMGLLLLLAGLAAVWSKVYFPPKDFDRDIYSRIRRGMSEQEVLAIVGCPPGDYGPTDGVDQLEEFDQSPLPLAKVQKWRGFEHEILVCYNDQGTVNGKWLYVIVDNNTDAPLLDRLRWWLGISPKPRMRIS
jgi:hypothetical protein